MRDSAVVGAVRAGHCAPVWDVEYSPQDRNVLCSVGQEGQLRMWDERKTASATAASMPQGAPLFCVAWSPSADMIVAGSENGEVLFFDPRSIEEPLQKWEGHADSVRRVVTLPGLLIPHACASALIAVPRMRPCLSIGRGSAGSRACRMGNPNVRACTES